MVESISGDMSNRRKAFQSNWKAIKRHSLANSRRFDDNAMAQFTTRFPRVAAFNQIMAPAHFPAATQPRLSGARHRGRHRKSASRQKIDDAADRFWMLGKRIVPAGDHVTFVINGQLRALDTNN